MHAAVCVSIEFPALCVKCSWRNFACMLKDLLVSSLPCLWPWRWGDLASQESLGRSPLLLSSGIDYRESVHIIPKLFDKIHP